jgi:hypothetical protein
LEINAAFAPESWVGFGEPTLPWIRGDSFHSRASFSPRLCGSAQCRRIVEIIKDALCGSGLNF